MILATIVAFFGLNAALVAYVVLRFTIDGNASAWIALGAFNAVLVATAYCVTLIAAGAAGG